METEGKGLVLLSLKMLSWHPTGMRVPAEENFKTIGETEAHTRREEKLSSKRERDLKISVLDLVIPDCHFLFISLPGGESITSTVLSGLV